MLVSYTSWLSRLFLQPEMGAYVTHKKELLKVSTGCFLHGFHAFILQLQRNHNSDMLPADTNTFCWQNTVRPWKLETSIIWLRLLLPERNQSFLRVIPQSRPWTLMERSRRKRPVMLWSLQKLPMGGKLQGYSWKNGHYIKSEIHILGERIYGPAESRDINRASGHVQIRPFEHRLGGWKRRDHSEKTGWNYHHGHDR